MGGGGGIGRVGRRWSRAWALEGMVYDYCVRNMDGMLRLLFSWCGGAWGNRAEGHVHVGLPHSHSCWDWGKYKSKDIKPLVCDRLELIRRRGAVSCDGRFGV